MRYLIPFFALLTLVACGGSDAPTSELEAEQLSGPVRLDGSSTVFPISEAVAEEYLTEAPRVRVTVGVSGTGGGFKKFLNEEIDINAASRPIKESEFEQANKKGIQVLEIPVAFDGLSVVVNPENTWVDFLTTGELKRIWEPESAVTTWKDVRDGWPDKPIRLYGPGTDSGTFDYFTGTINGKEQASRPDFTASEDDNVLVQGISGDLYSLGYFGFAYYLENQSKLRAVPIDGGTGPISPTPKTINEGTYEPLSRPIYIYINASALDKKQVADFVSFYLESAGQLAQEVGYISLPQESYQLAKTRVDTRTAGSSYHGETPLPMLTETSQQ